MRSCIHLRDGLDIGDGHLDRLCVWDCVQMRDCLSSGDGQWI